jgi:hypothetical protein
MLNGSKLAGGNPKNERADNDYYATNPESTKSLLNVFDIIYPALEPACGEGHISKLLDLSQTDSFDLIDRGFGKTGFDFLTSTYSPKYNTIITNPPFSLFTEFVKKSLEISNRYVVFFGKLVALEGDKRASFLQKTPLKYIYVFKKRQTPLINGNGIDQKTNKKFNSNTMAFAWFIWDKEYTGEPIIRWL